MTRAIWIRWLKQKQKEQEQFIDEVCEIAFGDSAKCVRFATGKPREFTDNALKWEEKEIEEEGE